jgi:hypothetical protein
VVEEPVVERGVVGDEDGSSEELEEAREDGLDRGRLTDHRVVDPGQVRDEARDRKARVDERTELAEAFPAARSFAELSRSLPPKSRCTPE